MPQIDPTKRHLLAKRKDIIDALVKEDYNYEEIGIIFFNANRSTISRIHKNVFKMKYPATNIKKTNTKN